MRRSTAIWDHVVDITASFLAHSSYYIDVDVFQGAASDRRTFQRDWNSLGLSPMIDEGMFKVDMREFVDGFAFVSIFEKDHDDDPDKFFKWVRHYPLARLIDVSLDGSHGDQTFYAVMFKDDDPSKAQAAIFKLAEY